MQCSSIYCKGEMPLVLTSWICNYLEELLHHLPVFSPQTEVVAEELARMGKWVVGVEVWEA